MAKLPLDAPEYRIMACRDYIALWQAYFQFFCDDMTEKTFTEDDERHFSETVAALSARHFRFTQLMGTSLKGGKEIMKILAETVSLSYLKTLPEAAFNKLQVDWHSMYLEMNKCLGKILASLPPDRLAKVEQNILQLQSQPTPK